MTTKGVTEKDINKLIQADLTFRLNQMEIWGVPDAKKLLVKLIRQWIKENK